jgi:RimJ/RimL family protein N-acetyltransferase
MQLQSVAGLTARSGSDADLPIVENICAEIWDGNDYVPRSWNSWGKDPNNYRFILEHDDSPAAAYVLRLGIASPTAGWIQGVRVKPSFRGRGIANGVVEHAMRTCQERGMNVLRYVTAEDNTPMHRVATKFEFRHTATFMFHHFPDAEDEKRLTPDHLYYHQDRITGTELRPVTLAEAETVWQQIESSPQYRDNDGFYCADWLWQPFTYEKLLKHIEDGNVLTPDFQGEPTSVVVRLRSKSDWEAEPRLVYRIVWMAGEREACVKTLHTLYLEVKEQTPPGKPVWLDTQLIHSTANQDVLEHAGLIPDGIEPVMLMYQKDL